MAIGRDAPAVYRELNDLAIRIDGRCDCFGSRDCTHDLSLADELERDAADLLREEGEPQDALLHPAYQVYFRAGLIACREYMARFVESQDPAIANSIRANWWPSLGPDYGPPRQLAFSEVTSGEYGTPDFRCKTADEVSPTLEALPVAAAFLSLAVGASPRDPVPPPPHQEKNS